MTTEFPNKTDIHSYRLNDALRYKHLTPTPQERTEQKDKSYLIFSWKHKKEQPATETN